MRILYRFGSLLMSVQHKIAYLRYLPGTFKMVSIGMWEYEMVKIQLFRYRNDPIIQHAIWTNFMLKTQLRMI